MSMATESAKAGGSPPEEEEEEEEEEKEEEEKEEKEERQQQQQQQQRQQGKREEGGRVWERGSESERDAQCLDAKILKSVLRSDSYIVNELWR